MRLDPSVASTDGLRHHARHHVTPETASQVPPQAVEQLAEESQKQDPTILERVSDFYAQNPTPVLTLPTPQHQDY